MERAGVSPDYHKHPQEPLDSSSHRSQDDRVDDNRGPGWEGRPDKGEGEQTVTPRARSPQYTAKDSNGREQILPSVAPATNTTHLEDQAAIIPSHNLPLSYRAFFPDNLQSNPIMSTMTSIHYDPRADYEAARASYTWSGFDTNSEFMNNNYYSIGPASDGGLSASSFDSRSITSSPPHPTLTAEQRQLKRQRDMARRDSKASTRAHRAMSGYRASQSPPQMSMSEYSNGPNMPVYTTVQPPLSLLSEPVTTLPGVSTYMPTYTSSPPLSDQQSAMFPNSYEYMGISYNSGYPSATPPPPPLHANDHSTAFSSHYRPVHEHSSMMYAAPSLVPTSGSMSPMGSGGVVADSSHVRVVQARSKPQCWEHGCNGRQFSTFSNLLRHQREKSGQATKSSCPNCGAEFTRTTARNGHLLHDKCKQRKSSPSEP